MNDPKIHIQPRFNNQMSIRLLFLKNYTFRKSTSEFCFLFFFFFQESNPNKLLHMYMYTILLPFISATDLTS